MLPDAILQHEIETICASYRITPEDARALCLDYMQRRPDLLGKILPHVATQDITRLKAYKMLMKEVRKHIYYHLRQYQPDKESVEQLRQQLAAAIAASASSPDIPAISDMAAMAAIVRQLLHAHVSTRERRAYYGEFYDTLFGLIDPPRRILDVGCGLHPLSYPYVKQGFISHDRAIQPDVYVAIDKQADVIETVQVFAPLAAPTRLIAVCADIGEVISELTPRPPLLAREEEQSSAADDFLLPLSCQERGAGGELCFDLALLLKLIPVVARQQRHLLPQLAALPARRLLITATAEAMTRKQNIRRREERVLRDFIDLTGRRVQAAFQVGPEFGFLLDTPEAGGRQKFS